MNKNYITTVEGRNGVQGFDRELVVHYVKIKPTEDAKRNKLQRKMQHDEMERFQLLNSLPMDSIVEQLALGEDLDEECFNE